MSRTRKPSGYFKDLLNRSCLACGAPFHGANDAMLTFHFLSVETTCQSCGALHSVKASGSWQCYVGLLGFGGMPLASNLLPKHSLPWAVGGGVASLAFLLLYIYGISKTKVRLALKTEKA